MAKAKSKKKPVRAVKSKAKPKIETAVITDVDTFKNLVRLTDNLLKGKNTDGEGVFVHSKSGLFLRQMDPANVAMIQLEIKPKFFKKYSLKGKDALNLTQFYNQIKDTKKDEVLTLSQLKTKYFIEVKTEVSRRTFEFHFIDAESFKEQKWPELNHSASIVMDSAVLDNIVRESAKVAEAVTFEVQKDKLHVFAEGDLNKYDEFFNYSDKIIASLKKKIKEDNISNKMVPVKYPEKSKFSVEYLKTIIPIAKKLFSRVELLLRKDYPLVLIYKNEKYSVKMILAPRVDMD